MKVIKTYAGDRFNRPCWTAVAADGRYLSNGYQQTTPAAALRVGEKEIALEAIRHLNGDSAAFRWLLEAI